MESGLSISDGIFIVDGVEAESAGQALLDVQQVGGLPLGICEMGTPNCDASIRVQIGVKHLRVPLGVGHGVCPADDAVIGRAAPCCARSTIRQHSLRELCRARRLVRRDATLPTMTSNSGITTLGGTLPVMVYAVAWGGWQWTQDFARARPCRSPGAEDLAGARLGSGNPDCLPDRPCTSLGRQVETR